MMTYTAAIDTLDLAKKNLLQIPMGVNRAEDTAEYQEAVSSLLNVSLLGARAFHSTRAPRPQVEGVA